MQAAKVVTSSNVLPQMGVSITAKTVVMAGISSLAEILTTPNIKAVVGIGPGTA